MKGILLLNGQPYEGEIDAENAYVVCCDGAYGWAKDKVKIDRNVGDFDSLSYLPDPPPTEVYPSEKNFTDGEIAMNALIDKGVDGIVIYGGGGGREDHFLGNLHLLYLADLHGITAEMITENSIISVRCGRIELNGVKGKTFSLLPFGGEVHIMGSTGCKYGYPERIGYGECRGISNIAESDEVCVEISGDERALIIINRGRV